MILEVTWHQQRERGRYLHAVTIRAGRKAKTVLFDYVADSQAMAGRFFWEACEWMKEKAKQQRLGSSE
jgi:hypothetical protein